MCFSRECFFLENALFFLILLFLLETIGQISNISVMILGDIFLLSRISHAYGVTISRESTPYRLVGAVGTWLIMLIMSLVGIYTYVT